MDDDGEEVIESMMASYHESDYELRSVLRTLFTSDYFKSEKARFARMKAPVEVVVGAVRQAGGYDTPTIGVEQLPSQAGFRGQGLLQPPTVEGWHEGVEWIESGSLVERVNFASKQVSEVSRPGVRAIIDRIATDNGGVLSPEELVDKCLDLLGPIPASEETRSSLIEYASANGDVDLRRHQPGDDAEQRVGDVLRLVASSREFQLA